MVYETATTTADWYTLSLCLAVAKYILQRTLRYNQICSDILLKT
jgi:hypothetical protein